MHECQAMFIKMLLGYLEAVIKNTERDNVKQLMLMERPTQRRPAHASALPLQALPRRGEKPLAWS